MTILTCTTTATATALTAAAAALLLAGCASFEASTPPEYTGPTVPVADQVVAVGEQLVHVFEMTRVDRRTLFSSSRATLQANQGRGFKVAPVALSNELPPGPTRVRLQGVTQYAAPILALTNPTCQVQGEVALVAEAGKRYRVSGVIAPAQCAVWIEDLATGQPVTEIVRGRGTQP